MRAEKIARALGGRGSGKSWMVRCPAHVDRTPSLSICDAEGGKLLVFCFAGCPYGEVIRALRTLRLWSSTDRRDAAPRLVKRWTGTAPTDSVERQALAHRIWKASRKWRGTLVETYLQSRGLQLSDCAGLRFHPNLRHLSGEYWPAMVALVSDAITNAPMAVHRTWLTKDGTGKAPVHPPRGMMGPCSGGVVRLAEPGRSLLIGEGIETCLSAALATGLPAWAAMSASGLRSVDLPEEIRSVTVLADGDVAGEGAARASAERWAREDRRVGIAHCPSGMDFNDVLLAQSPEAS